ncbi:hypothetical protein KC342_g18636 [Hortaea werneckii]|nr:hypothetical protein KC342_g18636 [Hortaea werneckii]KAI7395643.1 hypothetical protein KC328_g5632 [Hortaea werneckii]
MYELRAIPAVFLLHGLLDQCASALDGSSQCSPEGVCRRESSSVVYVCASGYWQMVNDPYMQYQCAEHETAGSEGLSSTSAASSSEATLQTSNPSPLTAQGETGATGNSFCTGNQLLARSDTYGKATYQTGSKMASVYDPDPFNAVFRCDLSPPQDGFYVAMWTRYDPNLVSQPQPRNCGDRLTVRNPTTGKSQDAMVIDRCASCVGVDHQTSDPTTPDNLVNGATIDLSPALWNLLFDGAPFSVYDIDYDGETYAGSLDGEPDALVDPSC